MISHAVTIKYTYKPEEVKQCFCPRVRNHTIDRRKYSIEKSGLKKFNKEEL